ncbi:MAG: sugar phosphate isomerase/epimerase [Saprospiraceae bacterium]|nr:sugar phosphate isomerase/epimerase [Saprospiraceae bacterium]
MERKHQKVSRRKFIGTGGTVLGATLAAPVFGTPAILKFWGKPTSYFKGVQIGVITYSFRSMPDQSAEATLQYIIDCGMNATELMGDPAESYAGKPDNPVDRRAFFQFIRKERNGEMLTENEKKEKAEMQNAMEAYNMEVAKWRLGVSMDKFKEVKKMFDAAGVHIYAFKPNAFGKDNSDAEIDYGMKAAKTLGASHVTLEHPNDDAHTLRLGKLAKKNKMYVAYHGHEQQTPTFWDTALAQSKYNAMNIDIGHYVAAGNIDPLGILKEKHDRILSMHVKDRQTPAHGKGNLPWGSGDTPIPDILQLMRDNQYKFPATVELEYEIPDGSDAVQEVKKCLEYCHKALEA